MTLRFDDGVTFEPQGDLRVERRRDGYYVVGRGVVSPVDSRDEGEEMIAEMEARREG